MNENEGVAGLASGDDVLTNGSNLEPGSSSLQSSSSLSYGSSKVVVSFRRDDEEDGGGGAKNAVARCDDIVCGHVERQSVVVVAEKRDVGLSSE